MTAAARWTPEQYEAYLKRGGTIPHFKSLPTSTKIGVKITPRRKQAKVNMIAELILQLKIAGVQVPPVPEFCFHPKRRWRSDLAWPAEKILVEYEGGIWQRGAHVRGKHYESDCEKYNEATLFGYEVYRFTYDMVRTGMALDVIIRALAKYDRGCSVCDDHRAWMIAWKGKCPRCQRILPPKPECPPNIRFKETDLV